MKLLRVFASWAVGRGKLSSFKSWLLFLILTIAAGCDNGVFQHKPSDDEVNAFLEDNIERLEQLVDFCSTQTEVRWFGREGISFYASSAKTVDRAKAQTAREHLRSMEMESILCRRDLSRSGILTSVHFSLYAVGLSIAGESKGLEFFIEESAEFDWLKPANRERWYIEEFQH